MQTTRTVQVGNISDLARERDIEDFFSFSGEIERIQIINPIPNSIDSGAGRHAFVTFKYPKALEIALLLSGATIVDQIVTIRPAENYVPEVEESLVIEEDIGSTLSNIEGRSSPSTSGQINSSKAQEVVSNMLAKGSAFGQDTINRAKAFDEKHQLMANASAKVISLNRRVGLSEKINTGISVVNEKVKSVDQRLHVSDKTMAALFEAERKLNYTGTAVKTNRFVSASTSWLNGAFSKVAKVSHVAGSKTREKFQFAMSNITSKDPGIIA